MKTKLTPSIISKFAREYDVVSFDINIHFKQLESSRVTAKVIKVYQNSVMVDVRHLEEYDDFTIINHKNYSIVERFKESV